jgi:hypothetical protein
MGEYQKYIEGSGIKAFFLNQGISIFILEVRDAYPLPYLQAISEIFAICSEVTLPAIIFSRTEIAFLLSD